MAMTEVVVNGYAVTHSHLFHADDVFAAAVLRLLQPDLEIRRSRDPAVVGRAALAFDVGGGRYDHHQPGGNGQRENGIPYAAFGLIWRDYGARVCGSAAVAAEVDRLLVQAIDASDNGVDLAVPVRADVTPVGLDSVLFWLNPSWQEAQEPDSAFEEALVLAQLILRRAIARAQGKLSAVEIVRAAAAAAADPRIIVLEERVAWQSEVCARAPDALYVVFPSPEEWCVQAVPLQPDSFEMRRPLPAAWAGLRDEALQAATGVADATFAHRNAFIAGATTRAGALALARLAVDTKSD